MDKYIQRKSEASSQGGEVTVALPTPEERLDLKTAFLLECAVDFFEYGHERKESSMV